MSYLFVNRKPVISLFDKLSIENVDTHTNSLLTAVRAICGLIGASCIVLDLVKQLVDGSSYPLHCAYYLYIDHWNLIPFFAKVSRKKIVCRQLSRQVIRYISSKKTILHIMRHMENVPHTKLMRWWNDSVTYCFFSISTIIFYSCMNDIYVHVHLGNKSSEMKIHSHTNINIYEYFIVSSYLILYLRFKIKFHDNKIHNVSKDNDEWLAMKLSIKKKTISQIYRNTNTHKSNVKKYLIAFRISISAVNSHCGANMNIKISEKDMTISKKIAARFPVVDDIGDWVGGGELDMMTGSIASLSSIACSASPANEWLLVISFANISCAVLTTSRCSCVYIRSKLHISLALRLTSIAFCHNSWMFWRVSGVSSTVMRPSGNSRFGRVGDFFRDFEICL